MKKLPQTFQVKKSFLVFFGQWKTSRWVSLVGGKLVTGLVVDLVRLVSLIGGSEVGSSWVDGEWLIS